MPVADQDKVLAVEAVGWADLAARKPMKKDSMFWMRATTGGYQGRWRYESLRQSGGPGKLVLVAQQGIRQVGRPSPPFVWEKSLGSTRWGGVFQVRRFP